MEATHPTHRTRILGVLLALAAGSALAATDYPAWWSNVVDRTAVTNDFAPATQGQLKWMATNAFAELEASLLGGAGPEARALVSGFSSDDCYYTANLGQLKYVASRFYDRLVAAGFAGGYPWTEAKTDDSDYSVANVGQLKNVFNFALHRVFADSGITADSEIRTWWSVASTDIVSSTLRDGGFEDHSPPDGRFPSGYWQPFTAGAGEAGALYTTTAAQPGGVYGLWNYTGTAPTPENMYSAPYQQFGTEPGDTWILSAYARQNGTWVGGSKGFVRLKFLNSLQNNLTTSDSPVQITSQGQGWTYCSVTSTVPSGGYFARMEVMILKPDGASGVAVANFDNCRLQKRNGFLSDADYGNFGAMPEGTRAFRTFAVNTASWGVFRTNGTVNLSDCTNGYLKFWLKSAAPSKVEVKSVTGLITNTSLVGQFGHTIESGVPAWQLKSIPVNTMPGVNLSQVASPFVFTDLGVTNSSFVDCVYWVKTP